MLGEISLGKGGGMFTVYLICGAVGSGILIAQLILSFIGFEHGMDADAGHIDFGGDHGGDFIADGDAGHVELAGDHGGDVHGETHADAHDDSSHFLNVLSLRTLSAAFAFFGLSGLAATESGFSFLISLAIAAGAGLFAMYIVAWLMRALSSLHSEGNVHIECALGCVGTVYLDVPKEDEGLGKVLVMVQNRTMEYEARCSRGALPTGTPVRVVDVLDNNTVQVEPVSSSEGE